MGALSRARIKFNYAAVGVPPDWHHNFSGFASHWNKNSNLGNAFDQWFLNLFPRSQAFVANGGGYLTLSFIPTLGTMILGPDCGSLGSQRTITGAVLKRLTLWGLGGIAFGAPSPFSGICPDRQADMDTRLDAFQRRHLFPVPGRFYLGN